MTALCSLFKYFNLFWKVSDHKLFKTSLEAELQPIVSFEQESNQETLRNQELFDSDTLLESESDSFLESDNIEILTDGEESPHGFERDSLNKKKVRF